MCAAARADHTNADCFVCCVLSHGDEGVIYGRDGTLKVDDLIAPFKPNALAQTLAGKPKVFFIQVQERSSLAALLRSVLSSPLLSSLLEHNSLAHEQT